ncbi:MAG: hypothetical protein ACO3JL_01215, partial [Myxococcota bacterium]
MNISHCIGRDIEGIRMKTWPFLSTMLLFMSMFFGAAPATANRCDDQNPCTIDTWVERVGCLNTSITGCQACTNDSQCPDPDNNLCTGTYYCEEVTGLCTKNPGTVVSCDESIDTACSQTKCDPATGQCVAVAAPQGTSCNDKDPGTLNDVCLNGLCMAGIDQCAYQADADCADDGNLCNGIPYCDKSIFPFARKTNAGTIVSCQASNNPCLSSTCDPANGVCSLVPTQASCDDNNACTIEDACTNGVCKGILDIGPAATCQCATDTDCLALEDGDLCNGILYCDIATGTCELNPATVVSCPSVDNSACVENVCDKTTGVCALKDKIGACDDGDACTGDDQCQAGTCVGQASVGGSAALCECQSDADCPQDENLCRGSRYCDAQTNTCVLNPATVIEPGVPCNEDVDCPASFHCSGAQTGVDDQGNAVKRLGFCTRCANVQDSDCEVSRCDPADGVCKITALADGEVCVGDGDPCTIGEKCLNGSCVAIDDVGVGQTCECRQDSDCAALEDGDRCNGTLYCQVNTATCELNPATVVICPHVADEQCAQDLCDPATGICSTKPVTDGAPCNDGDRCTTGDTCEAGQCAPGTDLCGCRFDEDCPHDDDLCTAELYCDRSKLPWQCVARPGARVRCGDEEPDDCYDATCQADGGCAYVARADGSPCDDGSPCTVSSSCVGGICEGVSLCGSHGECVVGAAGAPSCICDAGWTGPQCEIQTTLSTPCGETGQEPACSEGDENGGVLAFCSADPSTTGASH